MTIIQNCLTLVGIFTAMMAMGIGIGVGVAIGLEIVMRISGDGRTVLLTWARTKIEERT